MDRFGAVDDRYDPDAVEERVFERWDAVGASSRPIATVLVELRRTAWLVPLSDCEYLAAASPSLASTSGERRHAS